MIPVLDPVSDLHRRGPVPSFSHIPKKYAVIIDAGSSGSRIQVFSWSDPKNLQEQTRSASNTTILSSIPHISQNSEHNLKINPGISSYAGKHIKKLWSKHLLKLVKHAEKIVPKKLQYETPIHLLATAGMRLLPLDDQKQILAESCRLLQEKTSFYLPDCESHVSIIDGETEALYGWISLNYLLGTFDSFNHETQELLPGQSSKSLPAQTPSYGFMDMGGASMQVAFSPNSTESERHLNDLYHVRLRTIEGKNQNWRVFVSSWLGFGANEAKRRFAETLLSYNSHIGSTDVLPKDPCYPRGRTHEVKINENKTATFTGQGDLSQCLSAMQPLLRKSEPCKDDPCLFNGMHVPAIDFKTDRFVGVTRSELKLETVSKFIKDNEQAKSAEEKRSLETGKKIVGYVLHCKFTSNNTILTLTSQYVRVGKNAEKLSDEQKMIDLVRPLEDVKVNLTTGVLGFRNTKQGEYEAGFQTAARMFALIEERGYLKQGGSRNYINSSNRSHNNSGSRLGLELVLSNFGKGREAFLNALNGVEGNGVRPFVNRVTDNTKIKIGGVRPPRARRV